MRLVLAITAVLATGACQKSDSTKPSGRADCARVAETLATFELGGAAAADQRAPVVAKHRGACESTQTTAAEASCLAGAKDTWAARACLPRMFPAAKDTGAAVGCAVVVTRTREAVLAEIGSGGSAGSAAAAAVDNLVRVIGEACEQDGWPAAILDCIGRAKPGDYAAFQACSNQLPKDLQDKLGQRMAARQAALQQAAPPPAQPQAAPPAK